MKELMRLLREILNALKAIGGDKLAYTLPVAADQAGCSLDKLRQHIARKEITVAYIDHKPVIMHEELVRWLRDRPAVRPKDEA